MAKKRNFDYRHIICVIITLGMIALSIFVFPNALGRLIESFRDFGLSIAFFFCELFDIPYGFIPTITTLPKVPFFNTYGQSSPIPSLPDSFSAFKDNWGTYWKLFFDKENLFSYLITSVRGFSIFIKVIVLLCPFVILGLILFKRYLKTTNNDFNIDSKPLFVYRKISKNVFLPIKNWFLSLVDFIKTHKIYCTIWIILWLYNFNLITILVELFAYVFYFAVSFDFGSVYIQFYKLILDLWTAFSFIPLWVWVIVGIFVLEILSRKIAYNRLYHRERRNRGFINERGVVTFVDGSMGVGKTLQITDMALSTEVQFKDQAFEVILETDIKFPFFPWINFENALKVEIEEHRIYDLPRCRLWVRELEKTFFAIPCRENLFDYDYEHYGLTYDDKLKVITLWEALEDYACAYFIYIVQTSLLITNYSIRSDMLFADLGNFPIWNGDFFKRDSRLMESYSRHAHILDFDMMRLGKTMLKDNPNRNAFGFGVYVISEIDKERKNSPELQPIKADAKECNQKNDLFNVLLKMSRHACVVANRVFIKIFADFQRASSLNADALELGEIIHIKKKGERTTVLPFFAPFNILNLIFEWLFSKFNNFYVQYRFNRSDNTLFLYLLKSITAKLQHYVERTNNLFGSQILNIEVENGARNGDMKENKYFRQSKKIYSKRYSTDCLSGIFETRSEVNTVGLDDLKCYADIMATNDELGLQNSHFQRELSKLSEV